MRRATSRGMIQVFADRGARASTVCFALFVAITLLAGASAFAQQSSIPAEPASEEVVVTGSRIAQTVAQSTQPLSVISAEQISKTGLASVGDLLQQLTTGGSALNAKFNSSGNFGYPRTVAELVPAL